MQRQRAKAAGIDVLPEELMLPIFQDVIASSGAEYAKLSLVCKQFRELARKTHCVYFHLKGRTHEERDEKARSFVAFITARRDLENLTLSCVNSYPLSWIIERAWQLSALRTLHFCKVAPSSTWIPAFHSLKNLTSLRLSRSILGCQFLRGLGGLQQLTSLEVWANAGDGLYFLSQALGTLTSLVRLRLSRNSQWQPFSLQNLTALTSLDLSQNKLNGNEAILGQEGLGELRALTYLDLSGNPIDVNGAQSLAPVIERLESLKVLNLDTSTQYNVGLCYFNGKGIAEDKDRGAQWFRKAAERGDVDAQNHLGWCYLREGRGVKSSRARAEEWLVKAGEQGHTDAQCILWSLFVEQEGQDNSCGLNRKAAKQGQGEIRDGSTLGWALEHGKEAERENELVEERCGKESDQGHADVSEVRSSLCCENGEEDTDVSRAVAWIEKAANQGHSFAQRWLESMLRNE